MKECVYSPDSKETTIDHNQDTIRQLHKGNQSKEMITLFLPVDEDWFPSGFHPESLKNRLNALIFMSLVSFCLRFLDAILLCHGIEASVFSVLLDVEIIARVWVCFACCFVAFQFF